MSRHVKGAGSVYQRKDGRWEGAVYLPTVSGTSRRIRVYGKTPKEVNDKLTMRLVDSQRGIPVPERSWTVGAYLDYYMTSIAPKKLRPRTLKLYGSVIQLYLQPMLGSRSLATLTVVQLQQCFDDALAHGMTKSAAFNSKTALMSALTNAMREDVVMRNVARLVMLPPREPKIFQPWTREELARFLTAAKSTRLYPVFLILSLYGPRRGEAVGFRWTDVDWSHNVLRVRQQLVRLNGQLFAAPLKTRASQRDLPLLAQVREALNRYQTETEALGIRPNEDGLIFQKDDGSPFSAQDLDNLFGKLIQRAGLRRIHLHGMRHTAATLLKDAGVPDKDIQLILGHARVSTTQNLYEHGNTENQRDGLMRLEQILLADHSSVISRQVSPSSSKIVGSITSFQSVDSAKVGQIDGLIAYAARLAKDPALTSVFHQLRVRTNTHIFGGLAVNLAVKIEDKPNELNLMLWQWIALRDAFTPTTNPLAAVSYPPVPTTRSPYAPAFRRSHHRRDSGWA